MIPECLRNILHEKFPEQIQENESLRSWTTFRCPAIASIICSPRGMDDLVFLVQLLASHRLPQGKAFRVLGRGSNLLIRDGGYPGILIDLTQGFSDITIQDQTSEGTLVRAGGGVVNGALLNWARERSLAGFGWVYGIPGTVGGGVWMNAGTPLGSYGKIAHQVYGVDALGRDVSLDVCEKDFIYRGFPKGKETIITGAGLLFQSKDAESITKEIEAAKEKRKGQPIDLPNFGSVFKNPSGDFAGRLIEASELKGLRVGDAEISKQHANFIVNLGSAKTTDVLLLMQRAQKEVKDRFNVVLEPEVQLIGVDA